VFGYKYTKTVINEMGEEKELVVTTPTPANVLLRYYKPFDDWPINPEEWAHYMARASWRLQPVWRLGVRLGVNLQDDGKTPIYNPFDSPLSISRNILKFSAGQLIHILRRIEELPQAKSDKRAALDALRDDVGELWYRILSIAGNVYMRENKDKRKRGKMMGLIKEFGHFSSKKPLSDEAMGKAVERFERRLRSIMEAK